MNYSNRWLCHLKSKTVRELQIQQRRINPPNPTNSKWGSNPCGISRCRSCDMLCSCYNITSTNTNTEHGILGNLNSGSSNIMYVCEFLHCAKQYVVESNGEPRVRMNGHRCAINSKEMYCGLYTLLLVTAKINKNMPEPSLEA